MELKQQTKSMKLSEVKVGVPFRVIDAVLQEYKGSLKNYNRFTCHKDIAAALRKQLDDFEKAPDKLSYDRELAQIATICLRAMAGE